MKFSEYKYERPNFDLMCEILSNATKKIEESTNVNEIKEIINEISNIKYENIKDIF